jgi:hypothetical protein
MSVPACQGRGKPSPALSLKSTFVHYLVVISDDDAVRFRKQAENGTVANGRPRLRCGGTLRSLPGQSSMKCIKIVAARQRRAFGRFEADLL